MRSVRLMIWGLLVVLAGRLAFGRMLKRRGVSLLDRHVITDGQKPITRVISDYGNVDAEVRRRAEETADPRLSDFQETQRLSENRFLASVKFTDRSSLLRHEVFHPGQLIVLVDFDDGQRACRVVDIIKKDGDQPPVSLRLQR